MKGGRACSDSQLAHTVHHGGAATAAELCRNWSHGITVRDGRDMNARAEFLKVRGQKSLAAEKCFIEQKGTAFRESRGHPVPEDLGDDTTYLGSLAFNTSKGTPLVSPLLGGMKIMLR